MNILISYLKSIGKELGEKRRSAVLSLLTPQTKAAYLDLGCGDGDVTMTMATKLGTSSVFGIDIIDSEIKKARGRGMKVSKADLDKKFPYRSNTFDVITAIQVIEHLFEVDTFVSDIYRVLKPGGTAVVSTENLSSWHNVFALMVGLQPSTGPYISNQFSIGFHPLATEHKKGHKKNPHLAVMRGHTRVMAFRSFVKLFEAYGFVVEEVRGVGFYPLPGFLADIAAAIDPWHAVDVIVRLRKPG